MDQSKDYPVEQLRVDEWVQGKMAALRQPVEWQPNMEVGMALLSQGRRANLLRRQRALYAAVAAITAVGLLALAPTRVAAERCISACVAGTSAVGQLLGIKTAVQVLPRERKGAPAFTLPDAAGNSVSLVEFRGRVVVLNFWATWCGPCKVEIPWFVEFQQSFRERGLVVLGVSMDEDGWKSVSPYLLQHRVNYPVMLGSEAIGKAYGGVDALPSTFIIDKAGRVAVVHTGLVAKATYEDEIQQLLAEKEINK
jgi:cytochrome c biogenesis protein CcmG/thiol:disulfide interchange protein DsbE